MSESVMASTSKLSRESLEFAPGLLAIQENPPQQLPRAVLYLVATLFGILLIWSVYGRLDIVASAEGRLIPQNYVKVVQPADAGIVKEILVQEGERVAAGQVLLRLDPQDASADGKSLATELELRSLQLRRINAELSEHPLVRLGNDPTDLFDQIEAQLHEHRHTYLATLQQARQALNKAQHDYAASAAVRDKLKETQPILKSELDTFTDLGKKGYVPKLQINEKQREYLENQNDLRAQEASVASQADAQAAAKEQVLAVAAKYRSDLQNERIDAESAYRKLQQDVAKQIHKAALLELKAPYEGVVKDLNTHTVGSVVSAGTVLLSLVPTDEPLEAEVLLQNEDVGFVRTGQPVMIKLAAYPFQQYGLLEGDVKEISPDADGTEEAGTTPRPAERSSERGTASYRVLIALRRQTLSSDGRPLKLAPGMRVIAEIHQGSRTVLQYVLSPVRKTLMESGKER